MLRRRDACIGRGRATARYEIRGTNGDAVGFYSPQRASFDCYCVACSDTVYDYPINTPFRHWDAEDTLRNDPT